MVEINDLRGKVFTSYDDKQVKLVTTVNKDRKLVRTGDGVWYTLRDFLMLFLVG